MRRFSASVAVLLLGVVATGTGACSQAIGSSGKRAAADPAYAADLQTSLRSILAEMKVPGAVVMIRSPEKGDWTWAFGTRSIGGADR
ncbi:hypothetical protein F4553_007025 [Allocatelliglobosispora scoriae]|uniref:Beta-lactamase-related domain-containing protein n=1 Tax=Allocatelliglobosispora scoriae TaxID=643052 RepID=A0A841C434_9ACTN|nr:hypothetical protein [Allocatelliglobosispora scoriae]MBB5873591.1 hypothetical protein [Allocatelliglobosispora scoriae]